jgi:hypothetical protein
MNPGFQGVPTPWNSDFSTFVLSPDRHGGNEACRDQSPPGQYLKQVLKAMLRTPARAEVWASAG